MALGLLAAALTTTILPSTAQATGNLSLAQIDKGTVSLAGTKLVLHYSAVRSPSLLENEALRAFGDSQRAYYRELVKPSKGWTLTRHYYAGKALSLSLADYAYKVPHHIAFGGVDRWFDVTAVRVMKRAGGGATLAFTVCHDIGRLASVDPRTGKVELAPFAVVDQLRQGMTLLPGGSWKVTSFKAVVIPPAGACG
jgi:hypothetical protein